MDIYVGDKLIYVGDFFIIIAAGDWEKREMNKRKKKGKKKSWVTIIRSPGKISMKEVINFFCFGHFDPNICPPLTSRPLYK